MDSYFDQSIKSNTEDQQLYYGSYTNDEIKKKKKVVSDLLALRKMKMVHQERQSSPFSENFPVLPMIEPAVQPVDVDPLLKGTVLEKELNTVYGKQALFKATEHFSALSDFNMSAKKVDAETERAKFFGDISRLRKFKLEKDRQHRMRKQQMLFNKQFELTQKELALLSNKDVVSSSSVYDDDLTKVIEKTEKNLKSMEKNLRLLKIKYAVDLSTENREKMMKMEIEALKSDHPEEFAIASWIIDVVLEMVEDQCKRDEGNRIESQLVEMFVVADKEQYENLQIQFVKSEANLQLMNEIVDEVYPSMLQDLCEECIFLAYIALVFPENIVVDSSNRAAFARTKSKIKESNTKLVDESFASIRQGRERFKKDIWSHTQATIKEKPLGIPEAPVVKKVGAAPVSTVTDVEGDLTIISAESIKPRIDAKLGSSPLMEYHHGNEKNLWKSYSIFLPDISIPPKRSISIAVTCLSSDHKYLAIGSYKGDILVYDLYRSDFTLVRSVVYQGRGSDPVTALQWSLDNSRLISLSSQGCVIVWSISFAPYVSTAEVNVLNLSKSSFHSQQLTALCVLEYSKNDFELKDTSEQIKDGLNKNTFPSIVQFHPTLSTTGTQDSIIVALKDGNILKCNLFQNIQTHFAGQLLPEFKSDSSNSNIVNGLPPIPTQKVHKISQDINTEVFRFHRVNIIQIHFACNSDDMISLDINFNLCQWKHQSEHLNSFGWFVPYKKFELVFNEEVLVSNGEDEIVFEDVAVLKKASKSKKTKSKRVIEKERRQALGELEDLDVINRKPWFTDEFPDPLEEDLNKPKKPNKFFIRIFSPPKELMDDTPDGAVKFVVLTIKRSTRQLVRMAYRRYRSELNPAVSLMHHSLSPSGDRVHFMLLYDEKLPGTRKHVTFNELDLTSMKLGSIGPVRIDIASEVFKQCSTGGFAHFAVSRVDLTLGTEYLVSNIGGCFYIHSLLSGRIIIQKSNKDKVEPKSKLDPQLPPMLKKLKKDSHVLFINPDGEACYILIIPRLVNQTNAINCKMVQVVDTSSPKERILAQSTYKQLKQMKMQSIIKGGDDDIGWFKTEQTCRLNVWSYRHLPLELYMRLMLNTIIDIVLAKSDKLRMPQEMRKKVWKQDWVRMESYFSESI